MQIKNRQQFLVVLTIAAFALLVGVDFVYTPLSHWWSRRQAQIKNLQSQIKDGKMLLQRETVIRGEWSQWQSNSLPANTSLAEQQFFHALDDWSQDSGAQITSLMPQWQNGETNYMTLDCRVETSGDLGSLTRFLYSVEQGTLPIRVDTANLSSHDNAGQQLTLSLEIDGLALLPASK